MKELLILNGSTVFDASKSKCSNLRMVAIKQKILTRSIQLIYERFLCEAFSKLVIRLRGAGAAIMLLCVPIT